MFSRISAPLLLVCLLPGYAVAGETIRIKGSDTIGGRLAPSLAEAYRAHGHKTDFVIEALGSSTAFVGLFDGTADIGASSRPINERELDSAKVLHINLEEVVIGYDGVAIIVHPTNPVAQMTMNDLARLFLGKVKNWREVGGPDLAVRLISRPSYSGTHTFFRDKVLRRGNSKGSEDFAPSTEYVEDNVAIINAVAGDPRAISFVGLGWAKSPVRVVALKADASREAIIPAPETVRQGKYPLYRPLLFYVPRQASPSTREFVSFVLSADGARLVNIEGFVANDPQVSDTAQRVEATKEETKKTATQVVENRPQAQGSSGESSAKDPTSNLATTQPIESTTARREIIRISFSNASFSLSEQALTTLQEVAKKVQDANVRVVIIGHADSRGNAANNRKLSALRASTVAAKLIELGVAQTSVTVNSAGAEEPLASNETSVGRVKNRRVDIELIPR